MVQVIEGTRRHRVSILLRSREEALGLAEASFLVDERFDLHPDLPAR